LSRADITSGQTRGIFLFRFRELLNSGLQHATPAAMMIRGLTIGRRREALLWLIRSLTVAVRLEKRGSDGYAWIR